MLFKSEFRKPGFTVKKFCCFIWNGQALDCLKKEKMFFLSKFVDPVRNRL